MLPLTPSPSSPFENPSPSSSPPPSPPPPPPSPPQQFTDERGPQIAEACEGQPVTSTRTRMASAVTSPEYERKLNWPKLIITTCIASAFVIAFQTQYHHSHLPPTVIFISLALSISFLCILVGSSISSELPILAKVLEGLAIFFMIQCFLVAITILFPPMLKYTIWALYAFSLLLVLIFKWLKISTTMYISRP